MATTDPTPDAASGPSGGGRGPKKMLKTFTIRCYEPQSTPREASLVVDEEHRAFALYAVSDRLGDDTRDLRLTILRRIEDNPPPSSSLLFEVEVRAGRPGELPVLRVLKVGGGLLALELIRPDSRGRVARGLDIKSGARFEATLRDQRTIGFSLEVAGETASGKGALAGARPSGSKAVQGLGSLVWVVPNIVETIAAPTGKVIAWMTARAKRMGISPAVLSPMLLMSGFFLGAMWLAYDQYKTGMDTQERLEALQLDYEAALISRSAAVAAETECREQRKDLTVKLDDIEESRKLQAEIALATPLAHSVAIEGGGKRMGAEPAMEFDKVATTNVHKLVVSNMASQRVARSKASICLALSDKLGQDLPMHVLVWHPSPDFLCPEDYGAVLDGVDVAGHWGLSTRVAKEFGGLVAGDDPRGNERWSVAALTGGLRSVMRTILSADTGDRPPVPPGQLHLWTLALFDAYNRMPSPAGGAMDRPADECIAELIAEVARRNQPAEPGQPVLPSISSVVTGEEVRVTPSAGCPWPGQAVSLGAQAALRAVTDLALIEWTNEQNEVGKEDEG